MRDTFQRNRAQMNIRKYQRINRNWNSGTPPYGIFRANPDGGGFQPIDSDSDTPWYDLAVDATAVYYVHGGAIIRHPK